MEIAYTHTTYPDSTGMYGVIGGKRTRIYLHQQAVARAVERGDVYTAREYKQLIDAPLPKRRLK